MQQQTDTLEASSLIPQGRQALQRGQLMQAIQCFDRTIRQQPEHVEAWMLSGVTLQRMGRHQEAIQRFGQVMRLQPTHLHALLNIGLCREMLGESEAALEAYQLVITAEPGNRQAHQLRVKLLETLPDQNNAATDAVQQALQLFPGDGFFHIMQSKLLLREGALEAARQAINIASVQTASDPAEQAMLLEALGMLEEKSGDYEKAFAAFNQCQQAAASLPAAQQFPRDVYLKLIRQYQAFYAQHPRIGQWAQPVEDGQNAPVFLVGFPRSGTTLCEAMLDAHSEVTTSQDAPALQSLMSEAARLTGCALDTAPHFLDALTPHHLTTLRTLYWQRIFNHCPEAHQRRVFVDTTPLNIVELGFIQRIFPESPVIMALRDPRDVVLSCFKQLFRPTIAMVHFHTLTDTATLYAAVMNLWQLFQSRLQLNMLTYRYEDLVTETETVARRLLAHAGLAWEPEVLAYYRNPHQRQLRTASHAAVSRPVNRQAVGGWQHYATQLAPVLPIVQPFVEAFGYAEAGA